MTKPNNLKPSQALLVGRVNVGKSTLFNRILNRYQALTSVEANTTRDLNQSLVSWRGLSFWLYDSGGYNGKTKDKISQASIKQMQRAMQEASVILFVIDGQVGITPEDRELARQIRRVSGHPILVINKIDNPSKRSQAQNISLGIPDTVMVSAHNGSGVGDLLDLIVQNISTTTEPEPKLKMAFLGQTNVGKSSLFNVLLRSERSLVLPTPHTTRDRVHDFFELAGITVELMDTAGLRRQHNRAPSLEKQSANQSLAALKQIDVALITLDSSIDPSWQDQHIGQLVTEAKVAAIVLLNKADLVKPELRPNIEKRLSRWLPMLSWAPVVWISAHSGEGLAELIPLVKLANNNWHKQLTETELKSFWIFLKKSKTTRELPLAKFEQVGTCPPVFKLTLRQKADPPLAIGDWINSQLKKKHDFSGSPVIVRLESSRQLN